MSVKYSILALLADEPMYGYQMRLQFEERTGNTWPLNVGQVYTTLTRLERDGLVEPTETDDEGRIRYRITDVGRKDVAAWFGSAVDRASPPRDELATKLAMAVTVPGVDVRAVLQIQRASTMRVLRDYTKRKAGMPANAATPAEQAWHLVLESLIFNAEAEIRWLDYCERRLTSGQWKGV